jgi:signal transduction histidine kinase
MIEHVSGSIDLMNSAITDLRNISKMLSADYISTQSLPTLLQREVEVINKSQMFDMELITQGEERPIDPEKQLIIYRIAQECIQNAIKHSEAKKIQISFQFLPHVFALEVADDGKGFIYDKNKQGNGLTNLNARVAIIGAKLTIKSKPGEGTRILLSTPG